MSKLKDLHELIHSLTPAEKKAIRTQAGEQSKDAVYMRIFSVLNKHKAYDQVKIQEELKHIKNRSRNQQYLFEFILKKVIPLYTKNDNFSGYLREVEDLNYLRHKHVIGAFEADYKRVVKNLKSLKKYNRLLLRAHRLNAALQYVSNFNAYTEDEFHEFVNEYDSTVEHLYLEEKLGILSYRVTFLSYRRNTENDEETTVGFQQCLEELKRHRTNLPDAITIQYRYYMTKAISETGLFRIDEALATLCELMAYFDKNPYYIKTNRLFYNHSLVFIKELCCVLNEKATYEEILEKEVFADTQKPLQNHPIFLARQINSMWWQQKHDQNKEALAIAEKYLLPHAEKPDDFYIHNYFDFLILLAANYIHLGHPEKAISSLDLLLEIRQSPSVNPHISSVLMLRCIAIYEAGMHQILPHAVLSAKRKITRIKQLYPLESFMLKALNHISKYPDALKGDKTLQKMFEEFESGKDYPRYKMANKYFQFVEWLGSKIW